MSAIQPKVGEPVSDELTLVQAAKSGDVSAFDAYGRIISGTLRPGGVGVGECAG